MCLSVMQCFAVSHMTKSAIIFALPCVLQSVVDCCRVLQCVVVCCSVLQCHCACVMTHMNESWHEQREAGRVIGLLITTTYCNTPRLLHAFVVTYFRHTQTHTHALLMPHANLCNTLQHTITHCNKHASHPYYNDTFRIACALLLVFTPPPHLPLHECHVT